MRKMLFLFSAIFLFLTLAACSDGNESAIDSSETKTNPVETAKVKKENLTVEQTVFGHTSPYKQMPVVFPQSGELTDIKVKNGDMVKKDEQIATIKTEMGSLSIKAPIEGEVGLLKLEKNDFYNGEDPLAIIFDADTVVVQLSVTPDMKDKFKEDKKYKTIIDERQYEAHVKRIEKLPNETGQYDLIAHIDDDKNRIAIGSIAEMIISEVRQKNALLVPTEAVMTEGDKTYLFTVEGTKAKKIEVELLETQTEMSAIKGNLKEGDEVIIVGQFLLSDGSEIEVVKDGN